MNIFTALAVLFIGLKLAGIITWSWWFVTLPLWVLPAVTFTTFTAGYIVFLTRSK